MSDPNISELRSARWFSPHDLTGFIHRTAIQAEGFSKFAIKDRPVVGIANSWSELVNCNIHFKLLADAVKRGVLMAGGLPLEFPTISLGESLMKPSAMQFRNLMAMDVEESIRAYPLDAIVLLGGCDKTVPAQLMGAASADVPTIMLTGGPQEPAYFRGRQLGVGTDTWKYADELRAGTITQEDFNDLEASAKPTAGHCSEMGTASTMTSLVEALGMCLPDTASIPAVDSRRAAAAEATGRRAVEMAVSLGPRPSEVLTEQAFDNAITLLMAVGGSTNAVVHLLALARRVGYELRLDRFHEISKRTPRIVNVRPSGEHLIKQLFNAGGISAVLKELGPLLHGDAITVTGETLADGYRNAAEPDGEVISKLEQPYDASGGIAVVRGSLAPNGAVIKRSAASPELLKHRGPAVVFEDIYDLGRRIDDPALPITEDSVLVLRNSGPAGAPGMPEWGMLPIPERLLRRGIRDIVRISDARMSGTAFGTTVLHISPEAAVGGPLAAVRDGDPIVLDVENQRLDLDIPDEEIERRLADVELPAPKYRRGYGRLFIDHVTQADEGCDFDFLRKLPDEEPQRLPYGLTSGWQGGW
ncbi:dihydroxy-acid dehydratase [Streptomyces sp. 110]|uniref:Dihydroxy-acid dehydratase n=1 Tax=Streptomyces endocoffeicus TaxID=2898945 RepID=A0ABS1PII8_9ACTN|nr:IlvD/Edd family dehydratase [Streptomyces endocoffeicus]MBL1112213.1 dihydroxy-acid dehydratase [Streptomyces endocoffeicus]